MKMTNETNNTNDMIQNNNLAAKGEIQDNEDMVVQSTNYSTSGINIKEQSLTLTRGDQGYLHVDTESANAITWISAAPQIASVTGYNNLAVIQANRAGTVTITARQHSGATIISDTCQVTVEPNEGDVRAITISPSAATLDVGEQLLLTASFTPANATDKTLDWRSSDTNVVAVNSGNGMVLAKSTGTAIITAHAKDGSGVTATCAISVAGNRAAVEKDGDRFKVVFSNGTVWKSIGCDLYEEGLSEDYSRANHNRTQMFSKKQLAYLYLLDPLGVEYYMKNYDFDSNNDMTLGEQLYFKDNLYKIIFGTEPRYFRIVNNALTFKYSLADLGDDITREKCLSDAELVFGAHPIWDEYVLVNAIATAVYDLFLILAPTWVDYAANVGRALFYSASVTNALANNLPSAAVDYACDVMGEELDNANRAYGWVSLIIDIVESVADSALPDYSDRIIHQKVQEDMVKTFFKLDSNTELSFDEVIAQFITYEG